MCLFLSWRTYKYYYSPEDSLGYRSQQRLKVVSNVSVVHNVGCYFFFEVKFHLTLFFNTSEQNTLLSL